MSPSIAHRPHVGRRKSVRSLMFVATVLAVALAASATAQSLTYPLGKQDPTTLGNISGSSTNFQRGWNFRVNKPNLAVYELGCWWVNTATDGKTTSLYRHDTKQLLARVTNAPGPGWRFTALANPVVLQVGVEYMVVTHCNTTSTFYYNASAPANWIPKGDIEFVRSYYCNACAVDTYPGTLISGNAMYGVSDVAIGPERSTWSGSVSSDWSNPSNWLPAKVPGANESVLLPAGASQFRTPAISTTVQLKSLELEAGARLAINSTGSLSLTENLVDLGATVTNNGAPLQLAGIANQTISLVSANFRDISITNTSSQVTVPGVWPTGMAVTVNLAEGSRLRFALDADLSGSSFTGTGRILLGVAGANHVLTVNQTSKMPSFVFDGPDPMSLIQINGNVTCANVICQGQGQYAVNGNLTCDSLTVSGAVASFATTGNCNATTASIAGGPTIAIGGAFGVADLSIGGTTTLDVTGGLVASASVTIDQQASVTCGALNVQDLLLRADTTLICNGASSVGTLTTQDNADVTLNGPVLTTTVSLGSAAPFASAGTMSATDFTMSGAGAAAVFGLNLRGDLDLGASGGLLVTDAFIMNGTSGPQTVTSTAAPLACGRIQAGNVSGVTLRGAISVSDPGNCVIVSLGTSLTLGEGCTIALTSPTGGQQVAVQGALVTSSGSSPQRPRITASAGPSGNFARMTVLGTGVLSIDGLWLERFGPTGQPSGLSIDSGANVNSLAGLVMTGSSATAAIVISTSELPTLFPRMELEGTSPTNINASGVSGKKVQITKPAALTTSNALFGAGWEIDPNNVLNWSDPPAVTITSSPSLISAQATVPYSATITAAGGNQPLTFSLLNSPSWLSIHPTSGVLSGTPPISAVGNHTIAVLVTDSTTPVVSDSRVYTLRVESLSTSPLVIVDTLLPSAKETKAYAYGLLATGGVGPYTWDMLQGGRIPPGIQITSAGVVTGIPLAGTAGVYSFSARVRDQQGVTAVLPLSISVNSEFGDPQTIQSALSDATDGGGCAATGSRSGAWFVLVLAMVASTVTRRIRRSGTRA